MWDLSSPGSHTLHCKIDFQPLDHQGSPFSTSFDHNYSRHLWSTYSVPDAKLSFSHALSHLSFQRNPGAGMAMPTLSLVQLLSCVWLFATPRTATHQASLSITKSWSLLKLMFIESVMPSNHLILCCLLFLLPSIFPSIRVFPSESVLCIRWPKYWSSASASVLPMNSQDWFPLGLTGLISLHSKGLSGVFSNKNSKAWILQHSAFFIVQLSHPYMTTGKTIALTSQTLLTK